MKKSLILLLLLTAIAFPQKGKTKAPVLLKEAVPVLALKIQSIEGKNGSAVAYNTKKKLYYAAIAGNTTYPLEVFDLKGNNLHSQQIGWDVRGLWYNPESDEIQGNAYSGEGIYSYELDENGIPAGDPSAFLNFPDQPDDNSVGSFDPDEQLVYYLDGLSAVSYTLEKEADPKTIALTDVPYSGDSMNTTTIAFTGKKTMELAVLNHVPGEVCFFDKGTGKFTAKIRLPKSAVTNDMFRFSFANNLVFLYDVDAREWKGYKIFK